MYFLKAVLWFMVSMPIIVLFFQEHGLNLTEVSVAAIYLLSFISTIRDSFDILPIFWKKKSIVFSTILSFFGYLIFSLYDGFYALV